jgi:hypothetical protein
MAQTIFLAEHRSSSATCADTGDGD